MMFRIVFWDVLQCKIIYFTRQYIPDDSSEHQNLVNLKFKGPEKKNVF
jgi:hypothetical protein